MPYSGSNYAIDARTEGPLLEQGDLTGTQLLCHVVVTTSSTICAGNDVFVNQGYPAMSGKRHSRCGTCPILVQCQIDPKLVPI